MDIDSLIDGLIGREGGFVSDPRDRGGATRWGITEAVAREAGYAGQMAALPRSFAAQVYRRRYWLRPRYDQVATRAERIAAELFDTGVNMGAVVATGFLQRALNALNRGASDYSDIRADGVIGPRTLAALEGFLHRRGAAGEGVLLKAMEALQGARYIDLAEHHLANETFLYGWLANRIGSL